MVTAARPSRVRGNDWRKVKVPPVEEFRSNASRVRGDPLLRGNPRLWPSR